MKILTGKHPRPRRIMIYGQHGVGKSTLAQQAERTLFLDIEDGLNDLDCEKTEQLKSFGEIMEAISWLINSDHSYKHIAIDTIDWVEQLIWKRTAEKHDKNAIDEIAYGKGYSLALTGWKHILDSLEALRQARGCSVILLAHSQIVRFNNPESDSYDRYEPALHKLASSLVQEWCDEVLFASFRVFTKQEDLGFQRTRNVAVGGKDRFLRTSESASAVAKNRLQLPDELPMKWSELSKFFSKPEKSNGDIAGLVVSGFSKTKG